MNTHTWDIIPEKGEKILWQGRPQRRCGVAPWWWSHAAACVFSSHLLWGFTGLVPEGAEGFHEWTTHGFVRTIELVLALISTAVPFYAARITNGSSYVVTDRRLVIRKPWLQGSHIAESYAYKSIHSYSSRPLGEGLASFHFSGSLKDKLESTQDMMYAIPCAIANDLETLVRRAQS